MPYQTAVFHCDYIAAGGLSKVHCCPFTEIGYMVYPFLGSHGDAVTDVSVSMAQSLRGVFSLQLQALCIRSTYTRLSALTGGVLNQVQRPHYHR